MIYHVNTHLCLYVKCLNIVFVCVCLRRFYHIIFYCRFGIVGYGCMTCIGNSGPLPEPVVDAIDQVIIHYSLWDY